MHRLKTKTNELLVASLAAIFFVIMASNYFGKETAGLAYNVLTMSIIGPLVFFSVLQIFRNGYQSKIGKAWICFSSFVVLWFVAEIIWLVYDVIYHVKPWPSEADYFWLAGYQVYFLFSAYYMRPFRKLVSKKIICIASVVSVSVLAFTIYISDLENADFSNQEAVLGLAYPVMDAASLFPITIGLSLFLRGQVSFLWAMLLIGMLCFVVSDTGFAVFTLDDSYYSGHPIDTIYLWAYTFLLFGAYDQLRIFRRRNAENRFNEQETLR